MSKAGSRSAWRISTERSRWLPMNPPAIRIGLLRTAISGDMRKPPATSSGISSCSRTRPTAPKWKHVYWSCRPPWRQSPSDILRLVEIKPCPTSSEGETMRTILTLLLSLSGAYFGPTLAAQEARWVGHWEGALVITAAEQEVDVEVDFSRAGSQVNGRLWFPMTADGAHALEDVVLQGSHVSFSVRDKDGVVSAFDGALSPDGASLQGTM